MIAGFIILLNNQNKNPSQKDITNQCSSSCDDENKCTKDICSPDTNFTCLNKPIIPCCGNNNCESEERYSSCPSDCPKPEPVNLALTLNDFLSGWEIVIRGERTKSDEGGYSLGLGWVKGYHLTARKIESKDITITQIISVYPTQNISKILNSSREVVGEFKKGGIKVNEYGYRYKLEELSNPDIGKDSILYKQTFLDTGWIVYSTEFIKDDFYEYIGGYDLELVKELAKKAESKI